MLRNSFSDVDYDHIANSDLHTVSGAKAAEQLLFGTQPPNSLLDVGCGRGTWLRAALELGVQDIIGLDGIPIPEGDLLFPNQFFRVQDLCEAWDLKRRFDSALCLEVAEHLPAEAAAGLVLCLVKHSDFIFFSAAAPGQGGQHHVNCQWPEYWQEMFNRQGYACDDAVRWMIWDNENIEPWYRQNIFVAKYKPDMAGKEARILPVIHPNMLSFEAFNRERAVWISQVESGGCPVSWYLSLIPRALTRKFGRKLKDTLSVE